MSTDRRDRTRRRRIAALLLALALLVGAVVLSLTVGSRPVGFGRSLEVLVHPDRSAEALVVHDLRLPRTAVALLVGIALGVAGAVMQALTRNPLADPGILGVNAGASFAVVAGMATGLATGIDGYLWLAMGGAAVAGAGVHLLATGQGANPGRLALAGVAVSAALAALTETVVLLDREAFNEFRFWVAGSLEGRGWEVATTVAPFVAAGALLAFFLGPALNVLSLGEEGGRALGVRPERVRAVGLVAVTLLAGAATAAVGPIGFVGLAVPLLARALVGHDHRWVVAVSVLLGPAWVLAADCAARVVLAPEETQVGIIAALVGAPVFLAVVRRGRIPTL